MTDQEAMLATIIRHPDDKVTRLVYADWLDEHDEDNGFKEHAKLIRWQLHEEHSRVLPAEIEKAVNTQLRVRDGKITMKQLVATWLPSVVTVSLSICDTAYITGGFIWRIDFLSDPGHWWRYGPELIRRLPIKQMSIGSPYLYGLNMRPSRLYEWRKAKSKLYGKTIPWVRYNNTAVHDSLETAMAWYSAQAIEWAKNQKARYD